MADNRTLRQKRLANDYQEMQNMRGEVMSWEATRGTPPYVEEYRIWINCKTIIGPSPTFRDRHEILVSLPPNYPIGQPSIYMVSNPPPFHPNWYVNGKWCLGTWVPTESLGYLVQRAIRTILFDAEITYPESPANTTAKAWYNQNQGRGLFPIRGYTIPSPLAEDAPESRAPAPPVANNAGRLQIHKSAPSILPPLSESPRPTKRLSIHRNPEQG